MKTRSEHVEAHVRNSPDVVLGYIADVRNRPFFLPSLKAVSDIQGDPSAAGTTWKWKWVTLGMEFEGIGRCVQHEQGRSYSFQTQGGLESKWTYRAEAHEGGTKLSLDLEYQIPDHVLARLPSERILDGLRKTEAGTAIQNLKVILEK